MQDHVYEVIDNAVDQKLDTGKTELMDLAEKLAVWALRNNVNNDGSQLRSKGLALSEAIIDWADELYPDD